MTEAEWSECSDPIVMLKFLGQDTSEYKLCCFNSAWDKQFPKTGNYGILFDQPWNYAWGIVWEVDALDEQKATCSLLRDIFGNPFCPITVERAILAWNHGTIPKIAQAIYDDRAFDRLPILADALEEAGCLNA